MPDQEILLEKVAIGAALRVTAVCASTGVEIVFAAPAHATALAIEQVAAAKLARAKAALTNAEQGGQGPARRGVVV